jgi:4-hydroxy-2-oxoheptanedioate aldolase
VLLQPNQVKAKLRRGEVVLGSFVYVPSAKLTELVAMSGFDFAVIDQEHGPITTETAEDMVRACELVGCTPIIRVPCLHPHGILHALDIGAMGVHIPNVNTVEDARKAASLCRYAPLGNRGLAGVRAANYGLCEKLSDYCRMANEEVMVIAHIEDIEAIHNLDQLLTVDGIDVYYLGPVDLSNSLGKPGIVDAELKKIVDDAITKIVGAGKVAGMITTDIEAARRYVSLGVRYLATHAMHFMAAGSRSFLKAVKE